MAWNEPGKNDNNGSNNRPENNEPNNGGQNQNPWGNNPRGNDQQGPPDLDEVFNRISNKLRGFGGGGSGNNNSGNNNSGKGGAFGIGFILIIALMVWGFSGFYTVGEAERGVVLRLGKFSHIVEPGLNWRARFIDEVTPVNVQTVRSLSSSGLMLTKDENVVNVEMGVQYKITEGNEKNYLFQVTDADNSLRQAMDSAIRAVIGDSLMDSILTNGREAIRQETEVTLNQIIEKYDMGITIVEVNFHDSRPPEQVKEAFDDAIAAREDEEGFIRKAISYKNGVLPEATGKAERLKKDAQGYRERTVNEALGQVSQFEKLLPEYQAAPDVTRDRLYLDTMENIYTNSSKVLIDSESSGNMMYLPIDKLISQSEQNSKLRENENTTLDYNPIELDDDRNTGNTTSTSTSTSSRQGRL